VRATTDSDERASDTRSAFVVDLGEPTEPTRRVVSDRVVPDVRGMDTREAVRALHRAGFRVRLVPGSGAATAPSAGAVLRTGSLVQLAAGR
jgi:beta-lactam-binding protein with PASTA domain